MQRAFDKLDRQENRTQWKWTAGILAAFGVILLALVALTWTPAATEWISEATQAEFASTMTPEQAPLRTAQPAREFRTVRAN
jgi:uncharacterized protein YpmS